MRGENCVIFVSMAVAGSLAGFRLPGHPIQVQRVLQEAVIAMAGAVP